MKAVNRKRGGHLFPKNVNEEYRAWIRSQICLVQGYRGTEESGRHVCVGRTQACHIKNRGAGGEDEANLVPLCGAGHEEQHRIGVLAFQGRWGVELRSRAADYWEQFLREAGAPPERAQP